MNPLIQTIFASPDPNATPLTITELVALLNTLVTSAIIPENNYIPYVIGHDQPGVDDQDKAWIQTDTVGNPKAIKTFVGGNWRRVYNGMLGEIRGFSGVPGFTDSDPSLFDTTGKGRIGLDYDGWAICNGQNGTPDISDRFIIGAHMDNSESQTGMGYGGNGWQAYLDLGNTTKTTVDNTTIDTNGQSSLKMLQKHLPPFDTRTAAQITASAPPGIYLHGNESKDSVTHSSAVPIVDTNYANAMTHDVLIANYGPNPPNPDGTPPATNPQVAFPTLPPYYIAAWITFIGY